MYKRCYLGEKDDKEFLYLQTIFTFTTQVSTQYKKLLKAAENRKKAQRKIENALQRKEKLRKKKLQQKEVKQKLETKKKSKKKLKMYRQKQQQKAMAVNSEEQIDLSTFEKLHTPGFRHTSKRKRVNTYERPSVEDMKLSGKQNNSVNKQSHSSYPDSTIDLIKLQAQRQAYSRGMSLSEQMLQLVSLDDLRGVEYQENNHSNVGINGHHQPSFFHMPSSAFHRSAFRQRKSILLVTSSTSASPASASAMAKKARINRKKRKNKKKGKRSFLKKLWDK